MTKQEFIKEKKLKENAFKYFPNLYTIIADLQNDDNYQDYIKQLNKCYILLANNLNDKEAIDKTYNYLKEKIKAYPLEIELHSYIIKCLQFSYQELIENIRSYHFNSQKNPSNYGTRRNLLEISLFHPLINQIFINLDNYLYLNTNKTEFNEELQNRLIDIIASLYESNNLLNESKNIYHNNWKKVSENAENYSKKLLGTSRIAWKKSKNLALNTILNTIKDLMEINIALYYQTFDYQTKNIALDERTLNTTENLIYGLNNLKKSPYYYSYITEEEKLVLQKTKKEF